MRVTIEGNKALTGTVAVPADKSMTHRALMFTALAEGTSRVHARAIGDDNRSTARVLKGLGVTIEEEGQSFHVVGRGARGLVPPHAPLDCGNSGTTMRLMAGILAGAGVSAQLTGDDSLKRRPMGRICRPLRQLGGAIAGKEEGDKELPPLTSGKGAFAGGHIDLAIASAQVKSGLLLAGLCAGRAVEVLEPSLSRDHTERMLAAMGAPVTVRPERDGAVVAAIGPDAHLKSMELAVAGDFSSAAFLIAAALLIPGSAVTVRDVGVNATRTGLLEVLEEYGAKTTVSEWREEGGEPVAALTAKPSKLVATRAGGGPLGIGGPLIPRIIDELVVLAAIASQAEGETVVADAAELRVKESDRVRETVRLLAAFGLTATECPDGFRVRGPQTVRPAHVDVSADHRLALTAAVLALAAPGESTLDGFEIAAVSFPGVLEALRELGAHVRVSS